MISVMAAVLMSFAVADPYDVEDPWSDTHRSYDVRDAEVENDDRIASERHGPGCTCPGCAEVREDAERIEAERRERRVAEERRESEERSEYLNWYRKTGGRTDVPVTERDDSRKETEDDDSVHGRNRVEAR